MWSSVRVQQAREHLEVRVHVAVSFLSSLGELAGELTDGLDPAQPPGSVQGVGAILAHQATDPTWGHGAGERYEPCVLLSVEINIRGTLTDGVLA